MLLRCIIMGYQALLFCPDEKLARIVAQVFSDLEFNVEPVQEPFSAVKKLMAQRYDALVVDCENESNASLLFKSARNSTSNQGTLAIAVVEGQAGVAKAYRIGANLVLTKPINVEQAKGTLRVARGLLRKNSEVTAAPTNPAPATATPTEQAPAVPSASVAQANIPAAPARPTAVPPAPPKVTREAPEFEPVAPAIAGVAETPVQEVPAKGVVPAEIPTPVASPSPKGTAKPAAIMAPAAMSRVTAAQAAAAAPAKVKEVVPTATRTEELEPVDPVLAGADSEPVGSTPSFSALDLDDPSRSGGNKKILIAAGVVVAVAALGFLGWSKMGSQKGASPSGQSLSAPQQTSTPTPAVASTPAPSTTAPAPLTEHSSVTSEPANSKITPSTEPQKNASQATIRPQTSPEPEVTTRNLVAPIKVKSGAGNHAKNSSDDSTASVPSPLAVAEANGSVLNNLVSSPAAPSHPTLATLKISQGVSQGLLIKRVDPKYPPSALAMHVQGSVLLDATISQEGMISNVIVVKGDKILARAATEAVRQWRYKPYYLDGTPVEIQTQITINFKLPN
jgi:TonB family protein